MLVFRRNTIDFLHFRNGQVEVNTGLTLYSENAKIDTIDTSSDTDMVLKRNCVDFFKLQGPNVVANGPENLLLVEDGNVRVSSSWVFANTSANRTAESDTDFRGCISGGWVSGTVYMTYEHVPERLQISN